MGFDLMEWCNDNQNICIFILVLIVLQCRTFNKMPNMCGLEGFAMGDFTSGGIAV